MATPTPTQASDEDLAAQCDVAALYERYATRMLAFVSSRGVPTNDLDDVVQELWIRVYNGLKAKTFAGHFSGWVFRIARNLLTDRARKPTPPTELPDEELNPDFDTPPTILTRREVHDQLERCLGHLDERGRLIVRARTAGENYDEICESLSVERTIAYKAFHRATARLAECMKRAGYDSHGGDPTR